MKYFNALQLVILFILFPFMIQWLDKAEFRGAAAAFYSACAIYLVQIFFSVCAYAKFLEDW